MEMLFNEYRITIITMFVLGIIGYKFYYKEFFKEIKRNPFQEYNHPQIIASLGVLGTFIGITVGLFQFNTSDLQTSIPYLLEGMKTAFLTSLAGMSISLWMKYKQDLLRKDEIYSITSIEGTSLDDILSHLLKIYDYNKEKDENQFKLLSSNNDILKDAIKTSLEKMENSLVGDGESTLVGQLKFLRSDINDSQRLLREDINKGNSELINEFKSFAQQMAENNSKAFIEALNESMKDLNSKLQEQFGENFKQLNIAVGKLLDWQENYKNTLIETTENQRLIFSGIEDAKQSLSEMASMSSSIKTSAECLSDIIVTDATYQKTIEASLLNLTTIANQAKELIPNISNLHQITCESLVSGSNQAIASSTELNEKICNELISTNEKLKYTNDLLINSFNTAIGEFNELASKHQENIEADFQSFLSGLEKTYSDYVFNIADMSEKASDLIVKDLNKATDVSVTINKLIERRSQEVLDETNKALSSISSYSHTAIDEINQHAAKTSSAIEGFANVNIDTINKEIEAIQKTTKNLENNALEITKRVSDYIVKLVEKYNENLESTTEHINKNLEEELKKSLNSLGRTLGSLSEKFANDYTPLTEKLQRVVEISKRIN